MVGGPPTLVASLRAGCAPSCPQLALRAGWCSARSRRGPTSPLDAPGRALSWPDARSSRCAYWFRMPSSWRSAASTAILVPHDRGQAIDRLTRRAPRCRTDCSPTVVLRRRGHTAGTVPNDWDAYVHLSFDESGSPVIASRKSFDGSGRLDISALRPRERQRVRPPRSPLRGRACTRSRGDDARGCSGGPQGRVSAGDPSP